MKNNHIKKMIALTSMAIVVAATPLYAEEQLPALVVTADRVAMDQASVSADITIITAEEIRKSQAVFVVDLLRSQVGIDIANSGGAGKVTSVFMRGAGSRHALVLIDGVRVGSVTVGSFDWSKLTTADIERIEIVRGARSSLYGADAMGGVIQIYTRKGDGERKVYARVEAGSYATASGHVTITEQVDSGLAYALTLEHVKTDAISVAANGAENDPYKQSTLSASVSIPIASGKVELIARHVDGTASLDGGFPFGDVLNYTSRDKQQVFSGRINYPINDIFETSLQISRSTDNTVAHDPAGGFNNFDFSTAIDQLTWQNSFDLDAFTLLAGIDIHRDQGESGSAGLDQAITQSAAFSMLAWHRDMVDMNASVRYDHNSASENKATWKLGMAIRPLSNLKFSANYATGFKAPSINDLYFPASDFSAGNADLKPETSRGWDVGMYYQRQGKHLATTLNIVWFDQEFHNLISWEPDANFFYAPINIGAARTHGLELSMSLACDHGYLHANWTFLNAKDELSGDMLARRAKESGNIRIGAHIADLDAELAYRIVGPRFSNPGEDSKMLGYQKVDLRLGYTLQSSWQLTLRAENLTDKDYEEVSGYGVSGRAWYAGVNHSF
ncbi:MAG: TonB-dependent receptor [Mariprofundaceae bacterium]